MVAKIYDKFLVVKMDLIKNKLTEEQYKDFAHLMSLVMDGEKAYSYLVVNRDEPYANEVEKIILRGEEQKNSDLPLSSPIVNKGEILYGPTYSRIEN